MYQVFRFTEGICGTLLGSFSSLREAYDSASDLRRRDLHSYRDYRIHGPAPRLDICTRLQIHASTKDVWYILDSSDAQPPAIRASKVLLLLGQLAQPRPAARFSVIGLRDQYRWTAKDGFSTLDEAKEYAIAQHATSPETTFEVVQNTKTVARVAGALRTSAPTQSPFPRSVQRRPAKQQLAPVEKDVPDSTPKRRRQFSRHRAEDRPERASRRHDWEVEERRRDIALFVRDEDELGIGIPAQTGHGRRSRRGPYIP